MVFSLSQKPPNTYLDLSIQMCIFRMEHKMQHKEEAKKILSKLQNIKKKLIKKTYAYVFSSKFALNT